MSARTTADSGPADSGQGGLTCTAPSCWEPGAPVAIAGRAVEKDPILCETHRRAYLGVST